MALKGSWEKEIIFITGVPCFQRDGILEWALSFKATSLRMENQLDILVTPIPLCSIDSCLLSQLNYT